MRKSSEGDSRDFLFIFFEIVDLVAWIKFFESSVLCYNLLATVALTGQDPRNARYPFIALVETIYCIVNIFCGAWLYISFISGDCAVIT